MDLCWSQRGKSHRPEELDRGSFWRGTALDIDTKLRVARATGKNEEVVAAAIMLQIRDRYSPVEPPAIASDGNDSYPEAMLENMGKIAELFWTRPTTYEKAASDGLEMHPSNKASIWWKINRHHASSGLWRS